MKQLLPHQLHRIVLGSHLSLHSVTEIVEGAIIGVLGLHHELVLLRLVLVISVHFFGYLLGKLVDPVLVEVDPLEQLLEHRLVHLKVQSFLVLGTLVLILAARLERRFLRRLFHGDSSGD